nr:reverse transcriptase domain-containing protein [Tanacetum cinerariifolium]
QQIQELELQQLWPDSPAKEAKNEPNVWDDEPVDVKPFGEENPRYVNHLYQLHRNDHDVDRDDRYRDDPICSLGLKIEIPEFKEVINEFDKLSMRCDVVEGEEQVVARFLGVTKLKIADIAKNKGSTSRFTPPTRIAFPIAPKTAPKAMTPTTSAAGTPRECVDNSPHCYKCGGLEHYACDCSNLKTLAFVPDDAGSISDTDAEPELDKPSDKLVYPDHREALVI